MGQVTIYLEDTIELKMRSAAKSAHLSQSRWISNIIKEKIVDEWPDSIRKMAGSWKEFPLAEEIREDLPADHEREKL